jgi:hypothetical protein
MPIVLFLMQIHFGGSYKLVEDLRTVAIVKPRKDDSFLFCLIAGFLMETQSPFLLDFPDYSLILWTINFLLRKFYATSDKSSLFYLPLSEQAHVDISSF